MLTLMVISIYNLGIAYVGRILAKKTKLGDEQNPLQEYKS